MNERFARRRGAGVLSFSFPLAPRSADRSAERRERLSPNSWSGTTNGVTRALRAGHRLRPWTCRQITLVGSGAFDANSGSRNSSSPPRFAQRGKQLSISGNLGNGGRRRCSGNGFRISLPAPAVSKPLATTRYHPPELAPTCDIDPIGSSEGLDQRTWNRSGRRDLVVVRDHPLDLGNPVRLSARHEVLACNRSSSGTCGICAVATVSTTTRLCSTLLQ
jgi:hypothetical protein